MNFAEARKLMDVTVTKWLSGGLSPGPWSDDDFTYWAVSDVNINDLQSFKQLFEQQTARH